ncbi:MAG: type II secretion system GspH family protein, partial [Fusobacterium sp.]|nr:type II secretion system GspH family protein [Fusobacterium sp.]
PLSGFTMAEILLSLTIIGVVAAITLPSLTGNINERTWNTQRKALYARFSQAIALMPALNGFGIGTTDNDTISNAAQTFITGGLANVLKINNICDGEHLADCGIPSKLIDMAGSTHSTFPATMTALNSMMTSVDLNPNDPSNPEIYNQLNTQAAAFETQNGESIAVYYNPSCRPDLAATTRLDGMQAKICANFIYDLNGTKGPNTVGKDIGFITVLYPTDSVVVAPMPHVNAGKAGLSLEDGTKYCTQLDSEYRVPNKDEAAALFVNKNIIGNLPAGWLTTSSKGLENNVLRVWTQSTYTGNRVLTGDGAGQDNYVRCVKR